jgi:hypothetical protein
MQVSCDPRRGSREGLCGKAILEGAVDRARLKRQSPRSAERGRLKALLAGHLAGPHDIWPLDVGSASGVEPLPWRYCSGAGVIPTERAGASNHPSRSV